MREKAHAQGWDLLVIDTGDRVEGNGLYDSSDPKGVFLSEILRQQQIDLLSSGNHELYKRNTSDTEFLTTVPNFRDNYLASNIDIISPVTGEVVPLASRFKKLITPNQGIRIVAFGFIFDFTGNEKNTIVQPVEDTIKENWFQEAIRDEEVDLFLVIGHVPVRSKESNAILREIRSVHRSIPIQFFGGHLHIRDYVRYDSRASGLASGRFLETIGFMSIDNLTGNTRFNRRYIDNNLFSFHHHTNLSEATFSTPHGQSVSRLIQQSRSALQLDTVYGCVPRNFWMFRVKYPSKDSIYTWLEQQVLPDSLKDESRRGEPALAIVNSGAFRFDLFKGPFTHDTAFIVSPFTSGFRYVKDVPYARAQLVVKILNKQPQILGESHYQARYPASTLALKQFAHPEDMVGTRSVFGKEASGYSDQTPLSSNGTPEPKILPGYTTRDDGGTDGDDTVHSPIPIHRVPNCISSLISNTSTTPATVDLVYLDFIEPHMALAGKMAGLDVDFSQDSDVYMAPMTLTNLILEWVKDNWSCGNRD